MSTTVIVTIQAIIAATQIANIGTNLGLANLIWAMVNGSCLTSRGAIFTALHGLGLEAITVRHSWAALRYGAWLINELLGGWQEHVIQEGQWTERRYEEWRVISLDITAVPRPRLKNWPGKLYDGKVGRAVPAVGVGLRVIVGQVAGKRLALLSTIVRCEPTQNVSQQHIALLKEAARLDEPRDIKVMDAGFSLSEIEAAELEHFVRRMASNCTARRSHLPD